MEQRRLRLGDIVDDYCPRERRVTNHAIVAMVEEDVKQTRCTTCDAEHAYKGGAAPRRRKKDSTGALYKEVLAGITEGGDTTPVLTTPAPAPPIVRAAGVHEDVQETVQASSNGGPPHSDNGQHSDGVEQVEQVQGLGQPENEVRDTPDVVEDGPVHRPLIRATLPRVEGHKETRQATDFTVRQSNGRGANFQGNRGADQRGRPRGGHGQGQGQPSNRPPGGGSRFAGARTSNQGRGAAGRPQGGGFRAGQGQRRGPGAGGGGGRKRSR